MFQTTLFSSLRAVRRSSARMAAAMLLLTLALPAYCVQFGPLTITLPGDAENEKKTNPAAVNQSVKKAPAMNAAGWPITPNCRALTFTAPLDVDTAYARAMRKFSFATNEQMQRTVDQSRALMIDPSFKYIVNQGAFYHMDQTIHYPSPTGDDRRLQIGMKLTKEGSGTDVDINYCTNERHAGEDQPSYHDYVTSMLKSTFKPR